MPRSTPLDTITRQLSPDEIGDLRAGLGVLATSLEEIVGKRGAEIRKRRDRLFLELQREGVVLRLAQPSRNLPRE